ncbi:MAG: hypothetical protein A2W91_12895 [Bacteroidetes bacterium GWF2_38_335]|nr:MAG: hypothetical protein A2W91_12895 [Bacteroidetes bacterium GWF2_38_335]HBS86922.1 hypothetical protein [Bacteroidales bacterium]
MLGQMYHLIKDTGKTKQEINNELEEMGYLFMYLEEKKLNIEDVTDEILENYKKIKDEFKKAHKRQQ